MKRGVSSRKSMRRKLLLFVSLMVLLVAGIVIGTQLLESKPEQTFGDLETRFSKENISYQGKEYTPKPGLTTFLLMGTDTNEELVEYNGKYRSGGQCDFLLLVVIDTHAEKVYRIQIDRDTMAEITVLGIFGNELGTNTHQICLSHGFGDGGHQSCGFTVDAVKRLMYGINIDGYYSMNLNGISVLNDLIGGVTVTVEDDFSAFDAAMLPGAVVTLKGEQTELFVRSRMSIGDGTNFSRMRRQRQFLNNAAEQAIGKVKADNGFFGTLLTGLDPFITTDISRGRLINEANRAASYALGEVISPEGEYVDGADGFVEFHANQQALMELVLRLFYEPA